MKKWATVFRAIDHKTGYLKIYDGETVEAPTWELAQEWCNQNAGYLKVMGELIGEGPLTIDPANPDKRLFTDYDKRNQN